MNFVFGLANFRKIAHKVLSEFFDAFLSRVFGLVSPGLRPPESHAQNCRHSSPTSDF